MKTNWTKELDIKLVNCARQALDAGFHKTAGPKRRDGFSPGFWNAVAVLMADAQDSPTAGACSTRYVKALKTAERIKVDEGITEELKKFDETWEEASAIVDDYEKDTIEHIQDAVEANQRMLTIMLREWGVKSDQ